VIAAKPDYSMSRVRFRAEMIAWFSRPEFSHVITLAPNRKDITPELLRKMLGTFCGEVDKFMLRTRNPQSRYSHERLHLVAMPEKLDSNPHLHCVANFTRAFWQHNLDKPWEEELAKIWERVTRGAGSIVIDVNSSERIASYITKEMLRPDHDFYHSWDFHPAHRIVDENLKAALELISPTKKAA
jgi:hypothetical protein